MRKELHELASKMLSDDFNMNTSGEDIIKVMETVKHFEKKVQVAIAQANRDLGPADHTHIAIRRGNLPAETDNGLESIATGSAVHSLGPFDSIELSVPSSDQQKQHEDELEGHENRKLDYTGSHFSSSFILDSEAFRQRRKLSGSILSRGDESFPTPRNNFANMSIFKSPLVHQRHENTNKFSKEKMTWIPTKVKTKHDNRFQTTQDLMFGRKIFPLLYSES